MYQHILPGWDCLEQLGANLLSFNWISRPQEIAQWDMRIIHGAALVHHTLDKKYRTHLRKHLMIMPMMFSLLITSAAEISQMPGRRMWSFSSFKSHTRQYHGDVQPLSVAGSTNPWNSFFRIIIYDIQIFDQCHNPDNRCRRQSACDPIIISHCQPLLLMSQSWNLALIKRLSFEWCYILQMFTTKVIAE